MTVKIQSPEQVSQAAMEMENRAEKIANMTYTAPTETGEAEVIAITDEQRERMAGDYVPRVGRNDPCPCGSGKKYKACHGKLV
jgi:preprotein translocase subunit SecA